MYYIIKNELERKLKNPVFWVLILMIVILLYINIQRSYESNEFDKILSYIPGVTIIDDEDIVFTESMKEYWYGKNYEDYISQSSYFISRSLYDVELQNYELDKKAYIENDIEERYRISAFSALLTANTYANSINNTDSYLSKYICEIANE